MSRAQELATLLEKMKSEGWSTQGEDQAAALLRTQDALLRQALEFADFCWRDVPMNDYTIEKLEMLLSNLTEHLK